MPLVRIDVVKGERSDKELAELADVIQEVLVKTFNAPPKDRYQIIHEHKKGLIKTLDTGLGYPRTNKIVILQITQQGRTRTQKQAMYEAMGKSLEKIGVPQTDLIISVSENTLEDGFLGLNKA
ncbi:tautomerase [Chryseobacterium piperi]|uniref:Tautomerase n=1 Tax=Chryseobacterium piperi TaxID=558152 RepID=A0A086BLE8_9FLAO|nr:tautomerase family protein [Chryseobacterium piperi]KFF29762.1 tautomerase [Chryseobacterium piperi]